MKQCDTCVYFPRGDMKNPCAYCKDGSCHEPRTNNCWNCGYFAKGADKICNGCDRTFSMWIAKDKMIENIAIKESNTIAEFTGAAVNYYKVKIDNPTSSDVAPYVAECNDVIEALDMNFAEGEAFKAIWRSAAARTLGKKKKGDDRKYNAEKVVFYGGRMLVQSTRGDK